MFDLLEVLFKSGKNLSFITFCGDFWVLPFLNLGHRVHLSNLQYLIPIRDVQQFSVLKTAVLHCGVIFFSLNSKLVDLGSSWNNWGQFNWLQWRFGKAKQRLFTIENYSMEWFIEFTKHILKYFFAIETSKRIPPILYRSSPLC